MVDHFEKILTRFKSIKWIAYMLIVALILNGIGSIADNMSKSYLFVSDIITGLTKKKTSDKILVKETITLSRKILEFIAVRKENEPRSELDITGVNLKSTEIILYTLRTQLIFDKEYTPSLIRIRDEYLKRELKDEYIDKAIFEKGYLNYELIAYKLDLLAQKL